MIATIYSMLTLAVGISYAVPRFLRKRAEFDAKPLYLPRHAHAHRVRHAKHAAGRNTFYVKVRVA